MRHTVIGVFDTYSQAEDARTALVSAGFAPSDIELQANPVRDDAEVAPGVSPASQPQANEGVLANIERFFGMLFGGRDQPPEVAHYSEAVRRGGVLVAVDSATETLADTARATLADMGAIDIDERAASWGTLGNATQEAVQAEREHSILDEIGLGRGSAVPGRDPVNAPGSVRADMNRARVYPRADMGDPVYDPLAGVDPLVGTGVGLGGESLTGAARDESLRDPLEVREPVTTRTTFGGTDSLASRDTLTGTAATAANDWRPVTTPSDLQSPVGAPGSPAATPDEYMEYEDDFRSDYTSRYSATGARYEEYEDAYRFGASQGSNARYHSRVWDDEVESEMRRDWDARYPEGGDTWERFKAAVRHGWDRVTGHHV